MLEENSMKNLSIVPLIHTIDGEELIDLSDENIKTTSCIFNNVKVGWFSKLLDYLKKKINDDLDLYFPGKFDDSGISEYFEILYRRTMLKLDYLVNDVDHDKEITNMELTLLTIAKPKMFYGSSNAEIRYEKDFEDLCLILTDNTNIKVEDTTVLQFFNAFDYIKRKSN